MRKEELEQMRCGLESVSLIQFLQINHSCIKHVFPVVEWFKQYVTEVDQSDSGIFIQFTFNFGFNAKIEINNLN